MIFMWNYEVQTLPMNICFYAVRLFTRLLSANVSHYFLALLSISFFNKILFQLPVVKITQWLNICTDQQCRVYVLLYQSGITIYD